jgi:DNA segregation ATPase FtsK/SpoIIIE-like protein
LGDDSLDVAVPDAADWKAEAAETFAQFEKEEWLEWAPEWLMPLQTAAAGVKRAEKIRREQEEAAKNEEEQRRVEEETKREEDAKRREEEEERVRLEEEKRKEDETRLVHWRGELTAHVNAEYDVEVEKVMKDMIEGVISAQDAKEKMEKCGEWKMSKLKGIEERSLADFDEFDARWTAKQKVEGKKARPSRSAKGKGKEDAGSSKGKEKEKTVSVEQTMVDGSKDEDAIAVDSEVERGSEVATSRADGKENADGKVKADGKEKATESIGEVGGGSVPLPIVSASFAVVAKNLLILSFPSQCDQCNGRTEKKMCIPQWLKGKWKCKRCRDDRKGCTVNREQMHEVAVRLGYQDKRKKGGKSKLLVSVIWRCVFEAFLQRQKWR